VTEFAKQKILVVGGAGFVGSNLVKALLSCSPREVIVVDNLLSAERVNVPDDRRVSFVEGSITADAVLRDLPEDLDYVFHLATFHGNQNSMADPLADHENNTLTTLKLLERIKNFKQLKKVVYSSAGCTVAEKTFDKASATHEDAPVSLYLDSPYQMSKIFGEFYGNYYYRQHGVPFVKARFQNVYGPGEILGAGRWRGTPATVWRNVIPSFVYRSLKGLPLRVENGGIATRDFIYAEDIARGLMCCATRGRAGEPYNLASGEETCILDLANLVNQLTGNPTPVELAPKRQWDHSGKRFGSTAKAEQELGFRAQVGLEDGLRQTIAWTRAHLALIEACMAKHRTKLAA
jgi:nucleoside-diphosphate-sugar epimerase